MHLDLHLTVTFTLQSHTAHTVHLSQSTWLWSPITGGGLNFGYGRDVPLGREVNKNN